MTSPVAASELAVRAAALSAHETRVRWELLVIPLALLHAAVFVLPLVLFAYNAFLTKEGPALVGGPVTWRNFAAIVLDRYYQKAFTRSMYLSALAALATLILGYPAAFVPTFGTTRASTRAIRLRTGECAESVGEFQCP